MTAVLHSAPRFASHEGHRDTLAVAIGSALYHVHEEHGELVFGIERERVEDVLRLLRDEHGYQQLMDIAGVDYPQRAERFEVVYMLLSLTKNHRIIVKCRAAEDTPVPTVTGLWHNAGWLEREVFDMYGVLFEGNTDLRRILTDYGFQGHPFRKDFPLTGYQEVRYSEEAKRVVYEPVELPQDFRTFEFTSPWEGANYPLPGDEKAKMPPVKEVKVTEKPIETGAGPATDAKAPQPVAPAATDGTIAGQGHGDPAPVETNIPAPGAPEPTEDSPGQPARQVGAPETPGATSPDHADARSDDRAHDRNENS